MPSTVISSTPVTVTVCGVLQLRLVNVRKLGEAVPSVVSLDVMVVLTSAVGCEVRLTVYVAVVPDSARVPEMALTLNPAVSLSVMWAVTELSA